MTAILTQGDNAANLVANRTLEQFLTPRRQKVFGFDEFPSDLKQIEINGTEASSWAQHVNDGDTVVIKLATEVSSEPNVEISSSTPVAGEADARSIRISDLEAETVRLATELAQLSSENIRLNEQVAELRRTLSDISGFVREVYDSGNFVKRSSESIIENANSILSKVDSITNS